MAPVAPAGPPSTVNATVFSVGTTGSPAAAVVPLPPMQPLRSIAASAGPIVMIDRMELLAVPRISANPSAVTPAGINAGKYARPA